ncbi:MAG: dTMP kinase, partial [Oscillospiraceae bacterium]
MGKLIVIDGLDGSGKSTQFELLKKILSDRGISVRAISFPEYDKPSSALVKMYLNGEFSNNAEDINAYAASSFYAVDRYASYKLYWENDYKSGSIILASRYVSSNAIHQMVKLPESEWDSYLQWLIDYEYNKMAIPKADKVIFLDMPVEISQKLLSQRYNGDENRKDIHESNTKYLHNCRKSAL